MASVNKVILVGNLGRDPELRYTSGGTPVANFTMATTDKWKDQATGDLKEKTEWHRIVVWAKQAEIISEYLRKGRQVYVEGSLQTREWTDRDGNKRYTTEIKAQRVQMLGSRRDSERGDSERAESRPESQPAPTAVADSEQTAYEDDDIPF